MTGDFFHFSFFLFRGNYWRFYYLIVLAKNTYRAKFLREKRLIDSHKANEPLLLANTVSLTVGFAYNRINRKIIH
jgi:hypothetical protein